MMHETEVKKMLDRAFEEEALIVGGLAALYELNDDVVCRLMSGMDAVREKVLRHLKHVRRKKHTKRLRPDLTPHPAIEKFLAKVRSA